MRRFLCVTVLASLIAPAVAQQPRESTAQAPSQSTPASQAADEKSVELTIENQTGGPLGIYLINGGKEKLLRTLAADHDLIVRTYPGQKFRFASPVLPSGAHRFTVPDKSGKVTIDPVAESTREQLSALTGAARAGYREYLIRAIAKAKKDAQLAEEMAVENNRRERYAMAAMFWAHADGFLTFAKRLQQKLDALDSQAGNGK
jgi:hypothetical protein